MFGIEKYHLEYREDRRIILKLCLGKTCSEDVTCNHLSHDRINERTFAVAVVIF
jgi:hypothetical protein